jgi:hypothetical protein
LKERNRERYFENENREKLQKGKGERGMDRKMRKREHI